MNKKIILHLLKNEFKLRKNKYLAALLSISLIYLTKVLVHYFAIPSLIEISLLAIFTIIPFIILKNSDLIPSSAKSGSKIFNATYSLSYLYPTLSYYKSYLAAIFFEIVFDTCFVSIVLLQFNLKADIFVSGLLALFLCIYLTRFVMLWSVISGFKVRKVKFKNNFKSPLQYINAALVVMTTLMLLRWIDISRWEKEMVLVATVLGIGMIFILYPLITLNLLYNDPTPEPPFSQVKTLAVISVFFVVLFYLSDPLYLFNRSKSIIFYHIEKNNFNEIKKMVGSDKSLLYLKESEFSMTPALYAVFKNRPEMAIYFLENGADINAVGKEKWNLLLLSSDNCEKDLALYLVEKGIDIHAVTDKKRNALFYAARNKCFPLMVYYDKIGINKNLLDVDKKNYVEYASNYNKSFKEDYDFLKKIGFY